MSKASCKLVRVEDSWYLKVSLDAHCDISYDEYRVQLTYKGQSLSIDQTSQGSIDDNEIVVPRKYTEVEISALHVSFMENLECIVSFFRGQELVHFDNIYLHIDKTSSIVEYEPDYRIIPASIEEELETKLDKRTSDWSFFVEWQNAGIVVRIINKGRKRIHLCLGHKTYRKDVTDFDFWVDHRSRDFFIPAELVKLYEFNKPAIYEIVKTDLNDKLYKTAVSNEVEIDEFEADTSSLTVRSFHHFNGGDTAGIEMYFGDKFIDPNNPIVQASTDDLYSFSVTGWPWERDYLSMPVTANRLDPEVKIIESYIVATWPTSEDPKAVGGATTPTLHEGLHMTVEITGSSVVGGEEGAAEWVLLPFDTSPDEACEEFTGSSGNSPCNPSPSTSWKESHRVSPGFNQYINYTPMVHQEFNPLNSVSLPLGSKKTRPICRLGLVTGIDGLSEVDNLKAGTYIVNVQITYWLMPDFENTTTPSIPLSAGGINAQLELTIESTLGSFDVSTVVADGQGMLTGAGTYEVGEEWAVTATPASGWQFDHWTFILDGSQVNFSTPTVMYTQPAHNVVANAHFTEIPPSEVSLTVNATGNGTTSITSGTFPVGEIVEITAIPGVGETFLNWVVNGISFSSSIISLLMDENKTVIANFSSTMGGSGGSGDGGTSPVAEEPEEEYELTIESTGNGITSGAGIYTSGTNVIATAIPDPGWCFVSWKGVPPGIDIFSTSITLAMNVDRSITAVFGQYLDDFGNCQEEEPTSQEWPNFPSGAGNLSSGTVCNPEINIELGEFKTNDNPDTAVLPSGHLVAVYEMRDENGQTGIGMSVVHTSVNDNVIYYRSLSKGRLLNDFNLNTYGAATFEIFEAINLDNGFTPNLKIGFITSPFEQEIYDVTEVSITDEKTTIFFNVLKKLPFEDSNDAFIGFFLMISEQESLPVASEFIEVVSPDVNPCANPSVAVARNNLMVQREQHIAIAYQQYVNSQWNVYIKHMEIGGNVEQLPTYYQPYLFDSPSITTTYAADSVFNTVKYVVIDNFTVPNVSFCAIFQVFDLDGRQLLNASSSGSEKSSGCGDVTLDDKFVYVVATHPTSSCPSVDLPPWSIGAEFIGPLPPKAEDLDDSSCNPTISLFPEVGEWQSVNYQCIQSFVFDDPYCPPSPYVSARYYPEDLYVLQVDDAHVTRVVYHMSIEVDEYSIYRVVEKSDTGYERSHLKNAEVVVTYEGDLSHLWSQEKETFIFTDNIPQLGLSNKGLLGVPYPLASGRTYNIDSVHLNGRPSNWVYWSAVGPIRYKTFGIIQNQISDPVLIEENATRPQIEFNNRNDVILAYESHESSIPQIEIRGTGDFAQHSITGPKANRLTQTVEAADFAYYHAISVPLEGINQLCSMVIDDNDVVHIAWQSSRDNYWEIYYANGRNLFEPERVTESDSKSLSPSIEANKDGFLMIAYQDNRLQTYQIMMATKDEKRIVPLLQQDAYLGSLHSEYEHYTNILPIEDIDGDIDISPLNMTLEFYDNKNRIGNPISLQSFNQQEAFDTSNAGTIYFNAQHMRLDFTGKSLPYAFDKNATYFPVVIYTSTGGAVVKKMPNTSFSCNNCKSIEKNDFDTSACSYTFVIENKTSERLFYNFQADFFGDPDHNHLVKRFEMRPGYSDLARIEVNNTPALLVWTSLGLPLDAGVSKFIQVYPEIGDTSFQCGIKYYPLVRMCNSSDNQCSIFTPFGSAPDTFFCECSSTIFDNAPENTGKVVRWRSSANGYSDTALTDTSHDNARPIIKSKDDEISVVAFESHETDTPMVKAVIYNPESQNPVLGSGTGRLYDFDFEMEGKDIDIATDLYNRILFTVEKEEEQEEGKLPRNSISTGICDFFQHAIEEIEACNLGDLDTKILASDPFISSKVVKKIRIKPEDVDYFAYTNTGQIMPVVSKCQIKIEIYGTPEVMAFRIRNEDQLGFLEWIAWSPNISSDHVEYAHTLSSNIGNKSVTVQIMTYEGLTTEFTMPVIADYESISYQIELYKDQGYTMPMERYEGLPVAGNLFEGDSSEAVVYMRIIMEDEIEGDAVNYDIIQQGRNDIYNATATRVSGQNRVFEGQFKIYKEDRINNKDGLARIQVRFSGSCQDTTVAASKTFQRDEFNTSVREAQFSSRSDALEDVRQSETGRAGHDAVIRPTSEDPYFAFGDPDYFLKDK